MKRTEFFRGARDTVPLLVGAFPFGLIYGTLAVSAGMSVPAALGMSAIVFAGSAQFIAVGLIGAHAAPLVIIATTFIVNLRHMLYAANLLPYISHLPQRWKIPLSFWLTDEVFAVVAKRYPSQDPSVCKHWYQLGSSLAMYLNWQFWSAVGVISGSFIPGIESMGLDIAMVVTFVGMVVPYVKTKPMVFAVVTAGGASLAFAWMPYKLGLILAGLSGIAAGYAAMRIFRGNDHVAV
ncbi:MAG: AzlC family ABC transporter permease [Spirochaetales bacterium]|nr:AzlC family ABC transporter permease [Spirochaetales bacterium]